MIKTNDIIKDGEWREYKVISLIWSWWMAHVLKVERVFDWKCFAVKTLNIYVENGPDHKALLHEWQLSTEIYNNNVINYKFFHDGETYKDIGPYIIMELADENNLSDIIKLQRESNTFFSEKEISSLIRQIINWMRAINEKLIHRDIKPENILLKGKQIKISDFWISKIVWDVTRVSTFKWYGTFPYYAPEVFSNATNTIQMDIYSIWIVFYLISTLEYPYIFDDSNKSNQDKRREAHLFQSPRPAVEVNNDLPPQISSIIQKMIEKRPSNRYLSWDEIEDDLNN